MNMDNEDIDVVIDSEPEITNENDLNTNPTTDEDLPSRGVQLFNEDGFDLNEQVLPALDDCKDNGSGDKWIEPIEKKKEEPEVKLWDPRSNHKRWTAEEVQLFLDGVKLYDNKWTKIAHLIPTKSVKQVRYYGQRVYKDINILTISDDDDLPLTSIVAATTTAITIDSTSGSELAAPHNGVGQPHISTGSPTAAVAASHSGGGDSEITTDLAMTPTLPSTSQSSASSTSTPDNDDDIGGSEEPIDDKLCSLVTKDGRIIRLPKPTEQVKFDLEQITPMEKLVFPEFFTTDGRTLLDETRYRRLRDDIISMCLKRAPLYTSKLFLRRQLKNIGDVNILGRLHVFLEQSGVINFGNDNVKFNVNKTKPRISNNTTRPVDVEDTRKRRVRNSDNEWVNIGDLGGSVKKHNSVGGKEHKNKIDLNQFTQISYKDFDMHYEEPFKVLIDKIVQFTIDLQANLSHGEIIGLLGGVYNANTKRLHIKVAVPCDNVSTTIQCEMDAVSQCEALTAIHLLGYIVVGWYHSHPTFPTNPSVLDIETQLTYQQWFSQNNVPFVGIICNPFNDANKSKFSCFVIEGMPNRNFRTEPRGNPYDFDYEIVDTEDINEYLSISLILIDLYGRDFNKVMITNEENSARIMTMFKEYPVVNEAMTSDVMNGLFEKFTSLNYPQ